MIKKTWLTILFTGMGIFLAASEPVPLTLKEAEQMALKHNPEITRVENHLQQARIGTRQSIAAFFPTIDLSGQRILDEKVMRVEFPSFIPGQPPSEYELDFTKNYEMTLQVIQPLFTGGKILYNLKRNLEMKAIQAYLVEAKRNEIKAQTRSTYFSVLLLRKSVEIARDGLELATDIRNQIRTMYEEGMVTKLDLLRAENRITEVGMRLKEARSSLVEAQNNLKTLLDLPLNRELRLTGEFVRTTYPLNPEQLFEQMNTANPLLNSLENQVKVSQYGIRQAYGNFLPSLSLAAQYSFRGDQLDEISDWTDYYTISLNLSLPIFRGLSHHFNIALARSQKQDSMLQEKITQRNFTTLLTNHLQRDQTLREKLDFARDNLSNTEKEFEIARLSYDEGLISYTDLEQIHNSLLAAQLTAIQANFEYHVNIFQIETLVSRDIFDLQGEKK